MHSFDWSKSDAFNKSLAQVSFELCITVSNDKLLSQISEIYNLNKTKSSLKITLSFYIFL